jgi:hypothetical protein
VRPVTISALNAHEAMIGSGLDDGVVIERNLQAVPGRVR